MIQLPVSSTQKGFPCLGLTSSGSFNKWQGRFSRHFVIILKGKVTSRNKQKRHFVLNWHSPLKQNVFVGKFVHRNLPQRWVLAHATTNTSTPKHTPTVYSKDPQCTFGAHLFTLTAGSDAQVKLQRHIIIWRHLLTLTVHEEQRLPSPPPNRRTERWEQTRCLIHAEVSALKIWNAKSRVPLLPFHHTSQKSVLPLYLPDYFLSPLATLPSQERCHFHYSHGKVLSALVSKCWEISESLGKVTLHLSTLSGTYPVHSGLRKSKNYH